MRIPSYIENFEKWKHSFHFSIPVTVRFFETDQFKHLNNTVAFVYFEQARLDYFQSLGIMDRWLVEDSEEMIVVADLQCDYVRQVAYNETLTVGVKVEKVGRSSIDLHYKITNEKDDICLFGRGAMVQVNKQTGRSKPWSEEVKEILQNEQNES